MTNSFAAQAATDPKAEPVAQESVTPKTEPVTDQSVALIVGERAFATMEDVKTKIANADAHIGNIETENASQRAEIDALKAELATATSLDDVLARKEATSGPATDDVNTLVSEQFKNMRAEELSQANREGCLVQAETAYGKDFIVKMQEIATDLGLTMDDVDKMSGNNPRLFSRTFLPSNPALATPPPTHTSTIRTSNMQETPVVNDIKPVLSLTSKERTAQLVRQLEALQQN